MKRLQVVLDEMRIWEGEIFEKEYADANWFKGKQSKHVQGMEMARKRTGPGWLLLHALLPSEH
jgi:5'-3' exoribonuclease 1